MMYSKAIRKLKGNTKRNRLSAIIVAGSITLFGDIWSLMMVVPRYLSVMVCPLLSSLRITLTSSVRVIQEPTWYHATTVNVGWSG